MRSSRHFLIAESFLGRANILRMSRYFLIVDTFLGRGGILRSSRHFEVVPTFLGRRRNSLWSPRHFLVVDTYLGNLGSLFVDTFCGSYGIFAKVYDELLNTEKFEIPNVTYVTIQFSWIYFDWLLVSCCSWLECLSVSSIACRAQKFKNCFEQSPFVLLCTGNIFLRAIC